jgi:hypothetical protein
MPGRRPTKSVTLVCNDAKKVRLSRQTKFADGTRMSGTALSFHDPDLGITVDLTLGPYMVSATVSVGGACHQKFWSQEEIVKLWLTAAEYEENKRKARKHKGLRFTYYNGT